MPLGYVTGGSPEPRQEEVGQDVRQCAWESTFPLKQDERIIQMGLKSPFKLNLGSYECFQVSPTPKGTQ